jgi:hypothetical protein
MHAEQFYTKSEAFIEIYIVNNNVFIKTRAELRFTFNFNTQRNKL